jgi:hypothetical protein
MVGVVQFADLGTAAKPERSVSNCFLKFDGKKRVLDFESGQQGETHTEKKIDTDRKQSCNSSMRICGRLAAGEKDKNPVRTR